MIIGIGIVLMLIGFGIGGKDGFHDPLKLIFLIGGFVLFVLGLCLTVVNRKR